MSVSVKIGKLLRKARRASGMTQELLAERSRLSVRTVANIEAGRQPRPKLETLELLLAALHLEPGEAQLMRAAWRSGQLPPDDVPALLDPFFGREHELRVVRDLLRTNRLVTLAGLAGVGKTRLALAAIETAAESFDRVLFVPLAGARSDADVASITVARVGGGAHSDSRRAIASMLRGTRTLLILDSAEHVRAGTIALLHDVLGVTGPTALVTTQLPLSIPPERLLTVEPLPQAAALALLIDRAERAGAGEVGMRPTLVAICERLDRLPLAIELAAPKLRSVTPQALLERLNNGSAATLLSDGSTLRRYRTLHEAVAWNYAQLAPDEQRVLRALSTFAGSWPIHAAEDLCGAEAVLVLDRLVAANFITRMEAADGVARYWVLGTIRDFARSQLTDAERKAVGAAHVRCAAQLVRRCGAVFANPAEPIAALDARVAHAIDGCIEDVLLAVETAQTGDLVAEAIDLIASIPRYWPIRGRASWAARKLRQLIPRAEAGGGTSPVQLAAAYRALVWLGAVSADIDARAMRGAAERALELSESIDDDQRCQSYVALLFAAEYRGDADAAISLGSAGLNIARALKRPYDVAATMLALGYAFEGRSEIASALGWSLRALRAFEGLGDAEGVVRTFAQIAAQQSLHGDRVAARQAGRQALRRLRSSRNSGLRSLTFRRVADAETSLGNHARAMRLAIFAARETYAQAAAFEVSLVADSFAAAAEAQAGIAAAAALTIADDHRRRAGFAVYPALAARHDTLRERLQVRLGPQVFAAAEDQAVMGDLRTVVERIAREVIVA